jgi:hypothetical protein
MNYLLRALVTTGAFFCAFAGIISGVRPSLGSNLRPSLERNFRPGLGRNLGPGLCLLVPGPAGHQLLVPLLILIPLMPLPKDCRKPDDQQQRHQQHRRIEVLAIGLHIRPFVPARNQAYDNGNNNQQPCRYPQQELANGLFPPHPVLLPIPDKVIFFFGQHSALFKKIGVGTPGDISFHKVRCK